MALNTCIYAPGRHMQTSTAARIWSILSEAQSRSVVVVSVSFCGSIQLARSPTVPTL